MPRDSLYKMSTISSRVTLKSDYTDEKLYSSLCLVYVCNCSKAPMMTAKPAVIIVPAAFSLPAHYALVTSRLSDLGYEAHVAALASARETPIEPTPGMQDDAAVVRDLMEKLTDEGKEIILDMHS